MASTIWPQGYAAQLDRAVATWANPSVWDGKIAGTPAADIAVMMIMEIALHGWDVAKAAGVEYRVSPETGRFILQVVEKHAEMYRQYDGFADPVPVDENASPFQRALAASGRDPGWRPGAR